jgi:hypothetical protein
MAAGLGEGRAAVGQRQGTLSESCVRDTASNSLTHDRSRTKPYE